MIVTVSVVPLTALAPAGGFHALPLHMSMQHRNTGCLFTHSVQPIYLNIFRSMWVFFKLVKPLNTDCEPIRHKKVSWDEPASSLHVTKNYAKDQFQMISLSTRSL